MLLTAMLLAVGALWRWRTVPQPSPAVPPSLADRPTPATQGLRPDETRDLVETVPEVVAIEVPDDPQPTVQERALAAWEQAFEQIVQQQETEGWRPTQQDIARFKALFDGMDSQMRLEQIPHAQHLFNDAAFGFLKAILMDPAEPQAVLESIFYDLLRRPATLQQAILREVYAVKHHPLRDAIEAVD